MRTVSEKYLNRIKLQADEAELLGLKKIAKVLKDQTDTLSVREDDEDYKYSKEELEEDVSKCIWDAVSRIQDYFDDVLDARVTEELVNSCTSNLIEEISSKVSPDGVGKYECEVPGEAKQLELFVVYE
jgi:hypothetical protein